jgi:vancomycin permeability regulator SanA
MFLSAHTAAIYDANNLPSNHSKVGIVFGAGITAKGKPYKELEGRLNGAIDLYRQGTITKIVVSGDNRFEHYNEPLAMETYLRDRDIPGDAIQQDNAGRSTYETCERAKKVFQLDTAILITSQSHLPRAIFTCRKLGVESIGVAHGDNANNALRREFMARTKAVLNIYVYGEKTILGEPIPLDGQSCFDC